MPHPEKCACGCDGNIQLAGRPVIRLFKKNEADRITGEIGTGSEAINPDLYRAWSENLRKGVGGVLNSDKYFDLQAKMQANVSRFAAYKAYQATKLIRKQFTAADTDEERAKRAKAVLNRFGIWQQTEYNTTVSRTRTAKQWRDFNADPLKNQLYPNIKWLPSRSATLREEHIPYYNRVWAKDDPFWAQNQPGTLWNCKCDWIESDEPVNGIAADVKPAAGLEGNPGETGEIFTDNASYFKGNIQVPENDTIFSEYKNFKYLLGNNKQWRLDYYTDNEGVLAVERQRIIQGQLNPDETAKYNKEYSMCQTLVVNKQKVDFLAEAKGQYDILLNGKPADLKKTKSHNHIYDYARHAVRNQGADYVVFEFEKVNRKIVLELLKLKKNGYKVFYFTSKSKKLHNF